MSDSQQQKGGIGSTNVQIGTINTGLTYADVRDIATDVFNQNFAHLASSARLTADKRASEIREEVISKLQDTPGADPSSFSQVEKQVALLEAQKGYAISGDEELRDLLVKAVVAVSQSPERSKKSIVMSEAIKVAPLLTPEQLRTLGVVFAIAQVNFGVNSLRDLFTAYAAAIRLDRAKLAVTVGDLRHLEYAGCGALGLTSVSWYTLLQNDYAGLIQRGFTSEEADSQLSGVFPAPPYRPSVRNGDNLELAFRRPPDIEAIMPWTNEQKERVKSFFAERLISDEEVRSEVTEYGPDSKYLFEQWNEMNLSRFNLTSVGIAVGYTFLSQNIPLPDIAIWL
jgi:hypothetical protein